MYVDRKDEATLRDVVTEEVLVPSVGVPQTGWLDCFPQGPGRMRLVSTPLWSSRPSTCEALVEHRQGRPETCGRSGKPTLVHLPRRSGARLGDGVSTVVWSLAESRVVDGGGELPGAGSAGDGHACFPCAPIRAINDDLVVASSEVVSWVSVLAAASSNTECELPWTCILELSCASDSEGGCCGG